MKIIVGGIIEKNGKYLLVQEAKEKCHGKWNIPAGHLENNESLIEGAKREIYEECGCSVEITGILKLGNFVLSDDNVALFAFKTDLLDDSINYNTQEILAVKWFTYDEILEMKNELRDYDWITSVIKNNEEGYNINLDYLRISQ
ncbi:MAG: NUDIX domain-containing protein [Bacilli bacterium]|nr:NUDIX domain-containing protein [Bacilli bacterium]